MHFGDTSIRISYLRLHNYGRRQIGCLCRVRSVTGLGFENSKCTSKVKIFKQPNISNPFKITCATSSSNISAI